ncbi:sensor histidine kinase [Dehalobacterium formicoaceticum]|uniref:GHKL domain-containing protein n=1 Tax=Dehalobacterium formicoaceticum TaxID=51515 RepID=A0ABT1Y4S4_9FIRM|nr:sensor histidine kinase [Dehalobacterium formicoaceticum]MCR6545871.1 GHKL domain-containing protein [Dehalobacterium formicoaceticum]
MDNYDIVYFLSNIFGTYIIYRFMYIFFDRRSKNKKLELISYILYFLAIGIIYISYNTPIVNLICNLIMFFLLTLNYYSNWKMKLTAVVYVYAILISVETITIIILNILNLNALIKGVDLQLILAQIISKILSYIVVLVISNLKMIKAEYHIPLLHWIAVFIIPLGTLFSTFILMKESNPENFPQIFISIAILFIINVFVFYLYDILLQSYQEKTEKNLLRQQNNAYIKQLKIINQSLKNIKILRHDIKKHMLALQTLIEKGNNDLSLQYLQNAFNLINNVNEYVKSGNAEVDSILNYKIYEAKRKDIDVIVNLKIPEKLSIQSFDLVAILGNLLDNAIEATSIYTGEKRIGIFVELNRNVLYVNITNPFQEKLHYGFNKLKTTHRDAENHGFGLESVKKAIEKYNGTMNIKHTDNTFRVDVLIYNRNFSVEEKV